MKTAETLNENGIPNVGTGSGGSRCVKNESAIPATMPIAIIGMSCRFPGEVTNPEKLWEFCANAQSAWSGIPKGRFNQEAWYHPYNGHSGTVGNPFRLVKGPIADIIPTVFCERRTFSPGNHILV